MARVDDIVEPSLIRRILGSFWLKMGIFIALFLLVSTLATGGASDKIQTKQLEFLEDAVRRSAVQCFALEGHFPDSLSYLEEKYGLIIDRNNFAVYYESMGGNLLPQIRVIPLEH